MAIKIRRNGNETSRGNHHKQSTRLTHLKGGKEGVDAGGGVGNRRRRRRGRTVATQAVGVGQPSGATTIFGKAQRQPGQPVILGNLGGGRPVVKLVEGNQAWDSGCASSVCRGHKPKRCIRRWQRRQRGKRAQQTLLLLHRCATSHTRQQSKKKNSPREVRCKGAAEARAASASTAHASTARRAIPGDWRRKSGGKQGEPKQQELPHQKQKKCAASATRGASIKRLAGNRPVHRPKRKRAQQRWRPILACKQKPAL